jgi:hypothetical protein
MEDVILLARPLRSAFQVTLLRSGEFCKFSHGYETLQMAQNPRFPWNSGSQESGKGKPAL